MSFLKLVDLDALSRFKAKIMQLIPSTWAGSSSAGGPATIANGLPSGKVDSTSTATAFTATISGITEYYDGLTIILKNGVVTSASGFTLNINGLGAKPSYSNMATGNDVTPTAPTRETTIFNINYTMIFVYSVDIVDGGGWICYRGYDANTNTIAYQVRTQAVSLRMDSVTYRYRLLFQSVDGKKFVPANNSNSTNATASRTVIQTPIDPFGLIMYYGTTSSVAAGAKPNSSYLWQQFNGISLGYSFNRTGAALTMTTSLPIYLKCAPQSNGSAIIDSDVPFVQELPSSVDGKIYIFLGIAESATAMMLTLEHPIYEYRDGAVRQWGASAALSAYTSNPAMDGTASAGQSSDYARGDHVHPSDTSRLAANQGSANAGKFLGIDNNGVVVPVTAPSGGSEWELVVSFTAEEEVTSATVSFNETVRQKILAANEISFVSYFVPTTDSTITAKGTFTQRICGGDTWKTFLQPDTNYGGVVPAYGQANNLFRIVHEQKCAPFGWFPNDDGTAPYLRHVGYTNSTGASISTSTSWGFDKSFAKYAQEIEKAYFSTNTKFGVGTSFRIYVR